MEITLTEESSRFEWLESDGLGGFAQGTVDGIRTRRYQALLLAATTPPAGRMVLVNGFDAGVESSDGSWAISTQRYAPGVNAPDGATRITRFALDPWPTWSFAVAGGNLLQEIFIPRGSAAVVLRWSWQGKPDPSLRLRVRPFFSGRDFHTEHHENPDFAFTPETHGVAQRWHFYPGVPPVTARSNGAYLHEPCWYRNFLYDEELARGMDAQEDLAAPGSYTFTLAAEPAILIFSADGLGAAIPEGDAGQLAGHFAAIERSRRAAFASPRERAGDAYLVAREPGGTIIAGYPWFGDWGRDTFISMRGLCLATGRLEEARAILVAWAGTVSEGMLPNRFPDTGDTLEYNSVDASLWYIIVVHEFLLAAGNNPDLVAQKEQLLATVDAILEGYSAGTRFGIRADTDGLLACGVPGVQLTWMDAKVDDWVVTPRVGKPVEVQALWLNALALAGARQDRWRQLCEKGRASFAARFWNEARGMLYDVVDVDHHAGQMDGSLRPNQLFAVGGLPIALVDGTRAQAIVRIVQEKLWTPMGPRSLGPEEPHYAPHYVGDRWARDGAYHQGTVWPWLTGAFIEAWVRVDGGGADSKAKARALFLEPCLERLDLAGLLHIPEIADAEAPFTARGCPFQAWSVGEFLRLEYAVLADMAAK